MKKDIHNHELYVGQVYTKYDPLTGLYYGKSFFREADEYLKLDAEGEYVLVALDIEHFRLFNKIYGREVGDRFLIYVSECIKALQKIKECLAGYVGGDNFVLLLKDEEGIIKELEDIILEGLYKYNIAISFYPVFGVYEITDKSIPSETMYDRATIALSGTTGKFVNRICRYEPEIEDKIEEELKLLTEIHSALTNDEFTFYAQPQCEISTGKIVGAESLVRWNHKTKGLISPGVFIPVLEKNGIIGELDRYVWEKVCQWLRSWIDRGYQPVPISVNVSRIDISSMDVPAYLKELLQKYELSEKLLKVEITESAYTDNDAELDRVVKELRNAGFVVMMDDFGSGYSSLNMLSNVSVDVIKLDMRFLDLDEQEEDKGIGILESVINMAKTMGLPIIAEGVETEKQKEFLAEMGCQYIQGYHCYRPLSIEQYEELLSDERKVDFGGISCKQVGDVRVRELLDNNLFTDGMVNHMLGATAFYEVYDNQIEITRVNEQYYQLTGICTNNDSNQDTKLGSHVRDDDRVQLLSIFEEAYQNKENGASGFIHYMRADGEVLWVYIKVFYFRENAGHRMYYGSLVDMTSTRKKKRSVMLSECEINELTEMQQCQMERYYKELPCGYTVAKVILDESGQPTNYQFVYLNKEMQKICGGSVERLRYLISNIFADDYDDFIGKIYQAAYLGTKEEQSAYSSLLNMYLKLTFYQYEYGYVACMLQDATHTRIYEGALNSIMSAYREVYFLHLQNNYCRMIYPEEDNLLERGDYEEIINRHFGMGKILRYDEHNIRRFLSLENVRNELMTKDTIEYRYRRSSQDTLDEWCVTSITVNERENGVPKVAMITIRSIAALLQEEEERRRKNMAETLAHMSDGFLVYSASSGKIIYANSSLVRIFGCNSTDEFLQTVNYSFRGMVHPEDWKRIDWEIKDQIRNSEDNMDYIRYRILNKAGEERWVDDWGHLEVDGVEPELELFYVFISDITDTITIPEKEKLLKANKYY